MTRRKITEEEQRARKLQAEEEQVDRERTKQVRAQINKVKNAKVAANKEAEEGKLTIKQKKMIHAYFDCGKWSQAYIEAYGRGNMTNASISREANRLKNLPKVVKYLEQMEQAFFDDKVLTKNQVLAEWSKIATDPKSNNADKMAALNKLAEFHKLLNQDRTIKHEHSGSKDNPLQLRIETPVEDLLKQIYSDK